MTCEEAGPRIPTAPMFYEQMAAMIERMEGGVAGVHTWKDGWERIANGGVDVAFLDVGLPEGNGLDLLPLIPLSPEPETSASPLYNLLPQPAIIVRSSRPSRPQIPSDT